MAVFFAAAALLLAITAENGIPHSAVSGDLLVIGYFVLTYRRFAGKIETSTHGY